MVNTKIVMDGLIEFYDHIAKSGQFNLQEFVNFMEPKFAEAGYRGLTAGGGLTSKTNILILSDDAAGDFILTTGAIREIRRLYPDAYIRLVVGNRAFNLAECCPYADEILINEKQFRLQDFPAIYRWNAMSAANLLRNRIDICFAFVQHVDTPLLMYMSGARIRVSRAFEDDTEDTDRVYGILPVKYVTPLATKLVKSDIYGKHMADLSFNLLDSILNVPISNREIELWYTPVDVTNAKMIVGDSRPVYALCMGGSGPHRHYKHYPPDKYARVLEMIAKKESAAKFIILGGGHIDEESRDMLKSALDPNFYHDRIIDLTGKLSYRQSALVLKLCDMYIGNNTGVLHAASAVKCPVLEVSCFPADLPPNSNDLPNRWGAYRVPSVTIQPAHALAECKVNNPYIFYGCRVPKPHCITQIAPETIYKGFKLLKQRVEQHNTEPLYIH